MCEFFESQCEEDADACNPCDDDLNCRDNNLANYICLVPPACIVSHSRSSFVCLLRGPRILLFGSVAHPRCHFVYPTHPIPPAKLAGTPDRDTTAMNGALSSPHSTSSNASRWPR